MKMTLQNKHIKHNEKEAMLDFKYAMFSISNLGLNAILLELLSMSFVFGEDAL